MALQVWDGFDHYNSTADFQARSGFLQWQLPGSNAPTLSFLTGRNGFGKCLNITNAGINTNGVISVFGQRVASAFVGFGYKFGTATGAIGGIFRFVDSVAGAVQCAVKFNENNFSISLWRGDPTGGGVLLATSANNVWTTQTWVFVEIWPVIDGATGSITVDINGVQVAQVTGANTKATGNTWWDVMWQQATGSNLNSLQLDDLYYADTTAGAGTFPCSAPIGDCRVATLFANGNSAVQWTPSANTNFQQVSESAMDSDTTYNSSVTPGDEDLLAFQDLDANVVTVYGVQLTGAYRKDDASARTVKQALKSASTEVYGVTVSLPDTNYAYFTDAFILDPDTGATWLRTGVNAATAGYSLVS